jgi:cell division protein ZapB
MGMDIFDTLEDRVEKLLARKKALEEENAALRAEASRLAAEKKAVADRIDGLLEKLQAELDS